jgi:ADP-ribose pyrophosphatase YjhB (NUDIX family)
MERFGTPTDTIIARPEQYRGYPTERFVMDVPIDNEICLQGIEIPDGPWTVKNTPLPTFEQSLGFIEAGYETDSIGRPLHPWAHTLLSSEHGGIVTGKGAYYHWGPNATADPIVITTEARPRILLIQRGDTITEELPKGISALPGGFVDAGEDPLETAVRELREETNLIITTPGELVYEGPVVDRRSTLHAWANTSAYVFEIETSQPVLAADDARDAAWHYLDELSETVYGSHAQLIEKAVAHLKKKHEHEHRFQTTLALPEHERAITPIHAGHMAYKHYTVESSTVSMFVKEHDPTEFTDPEREANSRHYLLKEYEVYKYVASHGFTKIPRHVEYIENRLLALELLSEKDGCYWKARPEWLTAYVDRALVAFDELQKVPIPESPDYEEVIAPTYQTFWKEGWDAIDEDTIAKVRQRIIQFSPSWTKEQQTSAQQLSDTLEFLKDRALSLERDVPLYFAHNDARQSNLSFNPEDDMRLADWSWAGGAPKDGDITMLLIDLAKAGHSVEKYSDAINRDYALILIGTWLAHSTWQTRDGSTSVREHQLASAVTAFKLLEGLS